MKYREKATGEVVEADKAQFGNYVVQGVEPILDRYVYGPAFERDYELVPEYVGPTPDGMACNDRIRIDEPVTQTLRLAGFVGGFPCGYTVPLVGMRLQDYLPKVLIDAITNTYREDGKVTESWTAKNVKDGVVLTNNLTGALHELPKAAVEAILVLRGGQK